MLRKYEVKSRHFKDLCAIFHQSLNETEFLTSFPRLEFEHFVVKRMHTLESSYGIWFKNQFVMCVCDEPMHRFAAEVHRNVAMTSSMVDVVICCMIKAHKNASPRKYNIVKAKMVDVVRDIIAENSEFFTTDEIVDLSELLYGSENEKQLEAYD